jgi:hypothetical protein
MTTSDRMKVFTFTSQSQSREDWANRRTTIPYAAQRGFLARPNFGENRSRGNHHDFFRAHARKIRAQVTENRSQLFVAVAVKQRAKPRTTAQKCALLRADAAAAIRKVSGTVDNRPP